MYASGRNLCRGHRLARDVVVMVDDVADVDVTGHGTVLQDRGSGRSLIGLGHQGEVSMPQCNGMHASAALHAHVLANCAMNSHTISLEGGPSPVPERYGLWPTA